MTTGVGGSGPRIGQQHKIEEARPTVTSTKDSGTPPDSGGSVPSGVGIPKTDQSVQSRTGRGDGPKMGTPTDVPAMSTRQAMVGRGNTMVADRGKLPASPATPRDAHALMAAASNAKDLADRIQVDPQTGEKVPLSKLSPEDRKTVMDLRRLHNDSMVKLGLAVKEEQAPNVRPGDAGPAVSPKRVKLADLPRMSMAGGAPVDALRNEFKSMLPKALADKPIFNLKGTKAKNAVDATVYQFDQSLKGNSRLRVAMGLYPEQAKAELDRMVDGLKLSNGDKADLKGRLTEVMDKHVCSPREVQTAVENGRVLGDGRGGWAHAATFRGREVVIKTAKAGHVYDGVNEMLAHDDIVQNMHLPKVIGMTKTAEGEPRIVMEKVRGTRCGDLYLRLPSIPPEEGSVEHHYLNLPPDEQAKANVHMLSGMISGLEPMHAKGLGHWDLKTDNIMFNYDTMEITLIDFGLAGRAGGSSIMPDGSMLEAIGLYPENPNIGKFPQLSSEVAVLGRALVEDMIPKDSKDESRRLSPDLRTRLESAGNVMRQDPPESRPTIHQLKMIFDGKQIPPEERTNLSAADYDTLRAAFSPTGPLAGGREVMAGLVQAAGVDR